MIEEGPWQAEAVCEGDDPDDAIEFTKIAAISAAVSCRESGWKSYGIALESWPVTAYGACEQAGQGQLPGCYPESTGAQYFGIVAGKHVFRWAVKSTNAEDDGTGCDPDDDYLQEEHDEIAAPGCCAEGCQDASGCEANPQRVYNSEGCSCAPRPACEEPENCSEPPPCTVDHWYDENCDCCKPLGSPIIIDLHDNGITFSSPADGIYFDIFDNGRPSLFSWPTSASAYWLALDRNRNGRIDSGAELFGNATRLSDGSRAAHGYIALSELDANHDGRIDANDPIFSQLTLWRRPALPGNGSGQDEFRSLSLARVSSIDLSVQQSGKRDRWGNLFRYRAKVQLVRGSRWSYDVFLRSAILSKAPKDQTRR